MKSFDFEPLPRTPQADAVIHEIAAMAARSSIRFHRDTVTPESVRDAREHARLASELDQTLTAPCADILSEIEQLTAGA